jgi:Domain of unknown function (DUF4376)
MTNYIHIETSKYPVSETDIKDVFPTTIFPSPFVAPNNYAPVFPTPVPAYDSVLETVKESTPVLTTKGHYEQTWEIVDLYPTKAKKNAAIKAYLNDQKSIKKDLVDASRKIKESAGLSYKFPDSVGTIQTSDEDIRNVLVITTTALVLNSKGINTSVIPFKDLENVVHMLTPTEAISMGMAVQEFISSTYTEAWALKTAIESSTNLINLNKVIV